MRGLGDLESVIMDLVWGHDAPVTVRDLFDELRRDRPIAYTTVMSTMDNLYRKGWLSRSKEGKAYRYTATASREPVLNGHWLSEGTHLNVIGSNFLTKSEVDSVTVRRCDSIVVDSKDQARIEAGDFVQPLEEGSMVYLQFSLKDGSRLIEGMGKVVRVNPPTEKERTSGMGIEFVNFDEESMQLINEICAQREAARSKN